MWVCVDVGAHMVGVYTYVCMCVGVCVCMCVHVCASECARVCMYVRVHACVCVHVPCLSVCSRWEGQRSPHEPRGKPRADRGWLCFGVQEHPSGDGLAHTCALRP